MNNDIILVVLVLVLNLGIQCSSIRVPVLWENDDNSEVQTKKHENIQTAVETFDPGAQQHQQPIPLEYFQYTAPKPQFAVDVATFHGVPLPEQHYKAYPVRPYIGKLKPELGSHRILDPKRPVFHEYQQYVKDDNKPKEHVNTVSSNYEVFHPYKEEEPALQEIYKDPILNKIRTDIQGSKNRLQNYEKEAGNPDISSDEYLESFDQTDRKKRPQTNIPATYEIHRPLKRPAYYRIPPRLHHREQYLNQKFRNPWNHNAKVRPVNYKPLQHHLQRLREHHALTFNDERNEYPQLPPPQNYAEPPADGYDIYERGKEKYNRLRNNLDESINQSIRKNRPATYENLEMQNKPEDEDKNEEEDFVPIRNYAQVRKTETYKHLPQRAAFDDAESYDEIKNAPRLKEAVKSTKAQTVYSEEGYEDAAYDHAGEQKHADDHEAHGGFLREKELSGGNYKTPSLSKQYEDLGGSEYKDQIKDGKSWKDSNQDNEKENNSEKYSEDDEEHSSEIETQNETSEDEEIEEPRNKRENDENESKEESDSESNEHSEQHDVSKREADFKVPELNLNSTFLSADDFAKNAKKSKELKIKARKSTIKSKYPYYFKHISNINQHSPLRYAENLKFIPPKDKSETAFYDTRSKFQCPEVEEEINPVPENLENGEKPTSDESVNGDSDVSHTQPRLQGLGDKIDCFKAKYFGKNPLDSPFFKEEIIKNPEPLTVPKSTVFELFLSKLPNRFENVDKNSDNLKSPNGGNIFGLLNSINTSSLLNNDQNLEIPSYNSQQQQQKNVNTDILGNIQNSSAIIYYHPSNYTSKNIKPNVTYLVFQNKEDVTMLPIVVRKKRSTSFTYEPYKILRVQSVDSRKPKFLNHSIDSTLLNYDAKDQPTKRNAPNRSYQNIGRDERAKLISKGDIPKPDISFITTDNRRGEPQYEVKVSNHKSKYVPVEMKKNMSLEDYKNHKKTMQNDSYKDNNKSDSSSKLDSQEFSPSNTVRRIISTSTIPPKTLLSTTETTTEKASEESSEEEGDYDDEDDDEEEDDDENDESSEDDDEDVTTTTTTTTTVKPAFRSRKNNKIVTTTVKPSEDFDGEDTDDEPKLKLVTRFRNQQIKDKGRSSNVESFPVTKSVVKHNKSRKVTPKVSEKKTKISKSTLATDSNRYGEDEDDNRKEEVDALIGVKQDMDDYKPLYEKELESKGRLLRDKNKENPSENEDSDESDDEDEEDYESSEEVGDETEEIAAVTTPEPTKRSLLKTTEMPISTTETRSTRMKEKPSVVRKTIEIHKELPSNKSTPHMTKFRQDIKAIEIIKEMPVTRSRKRPQNTQKNLEALELYKDENLATEVNKLDAVEVFKENLDLKKGPKHGGNYRSAKIVATSESPRKEKGDAKSAQSSIKTVELNSDQDDYKYNIGRSKSSDMKKNSSHERSSKLIELQDDSEKISRLHGGNLKAIEHKEPFSNLKKSARFIELDDDYENGSDPKELHGGNFKSQDSSHENSQISDSRYRSARLLAQKDDGKKKDARQSAVSLLNSFAQAAPILTTTPAYIKDPSKRMYYYVDV